ncbi:hypothetical protein V6259_19065 [Marinomonas sp. TI.3.20]|uniref:hypothetical protein n=1 Tax=Marinomonas sp. TI.3.20 TaxID=3121296 RepID=UPI00311E0023
MSDQVEKLQARIDDILEPIAFRVASLDEDTIADAISIIPSGYYRTELRTLLNKNRTLE